MTPPTASATGGLLHEPLPVERIGLQPVPVTLLADERARTALAERLGLMAVEHLQARGQVRRREDTGWIEFKGTLAARVVQECVVSLEPVESSLDVAFNEIFDDRREAAVSGPDIDVDPSREEPEPIEDGVLDIGDIVVQTLAVSLDPYPRNDALSALSTAVGEGGDPESPFAKLALLKDRSRRRR